MKKKVIRRILIVLLILCSIIGIALLLIAPVKNYVRNGIRERNIDIAESAIGEGNGPVTVVVPASDFLKVNGEDGEGEWSDIDLSEYEVNGTVELTLIGLIEIPCIDLQEPIYDECSRIALRYGAGRFPDSANIGEEGNTIIFGHRNNKSKTFFWQLESLAEHIGDEVIVTTTYGEVRRYTIAYTVYASDEEIDQYLRSDFTDTEQLCVATCGYGRDPYDSSIYRVHNTIFIAVCVPSDEYKSNGEF